MIEFLVDLYFWSMGLGLTALALWVVALLWRHLTQPGTVGSRAESRRVRYLESMGRNPNADPVNVMGEYLDLAGYNIYRVSEKKAIISCKGLDELEIVIWSDFRRGEPYGVAGAFRRRLRPLHNYLENGNT